MAVLKRAKDLKDLRSQFDSIRSIVAGDTRFGAQAILFVSERLARIEVLLEQQVKLAQQSQARPKRRPTEWQRFFAAGMKAGRTPAEIGAAWRATKK